MDMTSFNSGDAGSKLPTQSQRGKKKPCGDEWANKKKSYSYAHILKEGGKEQLRDSLGRFAKAIAAFAKHPLANYRLANRHLQSYNHSRGEGFFSTMGHVVGLKEEKDQQKNDIVS